MVNLAEAGVGDMIRLRAGYVLSITAITGKGRVFDIACDAGFEMTYLVNGWVFMKDKHTPLDIVAVIQKGMGDLAPIVAIVRKAVVGLRSVGLVEQRHRCERALFEIYDMTKNVQLPEPGPLRSE